MCAWRFLTFTPVCLNGPASHLEGRHGGVFQLWVWSCLTQRELQYFRTLFKGACEKCTFLPRHFTMPSTSMYFGSSCMAQARYFGISTDETRLWACGTWVTYFRVASHLVCSVVSEPATFAQTLPLFTGDGQTVLGSELPSMRSWPPTTIILTVTKNNKNTYVIMSSSHPHSMTNMTQRCCSPTWLSKQLCCPNHVASSFASIPSPPTKRTISNSFHLSSTVSASFHTKIAFRRQSIQNCFENYRHPTHPQDSSNQNYLKHVARIQLNLNAAYCQASLG